MKPDLLLMLDVVPERLARIQEAFNVRLVKTPEERIRAVREYGATIRAVVTNGTTGCSRAFMEAMPKLEIVSTLGAGHENVDLEAARERGITVTHGPGTNTSCVADTAIALLFAIVRDIPEFDRQVKGGTWHGVPRPSLYGKRLGILGLGRIGLEIAKRSAGFAMPVTYHNRRQRADVDYAYAPSVLDLARASDFLIVASPGGKETFHLVDAGVMDALGPSGFLVNIGRGSVVDTQALIAALRDGRLGGAALDTIENEPNVPDELRALSNVILTPHCSGRSPETQEAITNLLMANLTAHFAGKPVLTPVQAR